ncbi:TPA: hypothetical protein HH295_04240 [Xanthomonas vasicola pv. zeae]|uniref:Uncharacterized protein n=2 Tax=Xanthomonas vasicola TaxID=56459 RepID=A0AAE8JVB2_XANVA|nr:hypothetical protein [Xanthomonas vasicola]AZR28255.1 hypothetical protein NX80_019365 [Xanthomonas vasicola pv. arecae]AZR32507.1 hypothetical protein KWO_020440 [Xanthomonas vasicola pv. musacearum NCPPB 4379]MBV7277754.1 hypothetical protein [Xanthomonas vasicola pv. musacearum]AVQ08353.1 hypothetical protein C7V42_18865 [Xanthomonas vasicola pv. vasculorum]AZM72551.1 hypothetical protein CXP37_18880 [Xanthomonas vasicola pv. vasculorum]
MRYRKYFGLFSVTLLLATSAYGQNYRTATAPSISLVTTQKSLYRAGSNESQSIVAWIKQHSPKYPPLLPASSLSVSRSIVSTGLMSIQSGPYGPPVPLPASGVPGEKITIRNEFPGGAFEQWDYEWAGQSGGSWQLTGYQFSAPTSKGDNDSPRQPF